MILQKGEKVHVIHRRHYEKDLHRHFIGVVDAYEQGVARVTGHVYTVDSVKFSFLKRAGHRDAVFVEESQKWFDALWETITSDMTLS